MVYTNVEVNLIDLDTDDMIDELYNRGLITINPENKYSELKECAICEIKNAIERKNERPENLYKYASELPYEEQAELARLLLSTTHVRDAWKRNG